MVQYSFLPCFNSQLVFIAALLLQSLEVRTFHFKPCSMQFRNYCKWAVLIGTLLIWIIKLGIRPYIQYDFVKFTLGIAPNFIGSLLVPFAAYWLYTHEHFFNGRLMRFPFFSDNRFVCLFGFSLAVINEYLQLIPVFGRTFDYFDILFSAFGLVLSYYSFLLLQRRAVMSYDRQ